MAKKTTRRVSKRRAAAPPSRAARSARGGRAVKASATASFPSRIYAIASPRSIGGVSLFEPGFVATAGTVMNFASQTDVVQSAAQRLQNAGFEVLQATQFMINISGSRTTYEKAFKTQLVVEDRDTIKERGKKAKAQFIDSPTTPVSGLISTAGTSFEDVIEGVALEEPRYLMAPNPFAPTKTYWHLDVPAGVSLGCNADRAHRDGITGRGIRVAMVDSGHYAHPFFADRGYRVAAVTLGPATADPDKDELGHGTGESANIFAVAPDAELLPVKALLAGTLNTVLVNSTGAFNAAVALNPDIITCSWGFDIENGPLSAAQQALAAAVAAAVASGIVVVFSAGNGHFGFPGQHPDVISAGGVFMDQNGALQASDYASGFMSNIYAGRRVPDLSGLVGMMPKAAYIMLPVEPGDDLDTDIAGGTHPNGDETTPNDGWAAFSGTSAAAPQIAGAAALVKQACPQLSPASVKDVLMKTARDVTTGHNHSRFNNQAVVGPDTATGDGLVDASKAVLLAKVRCVGIPIFPLQPLQPLIPLQPLHPIQPLHPTLPLFPLQPLVPLHPISPTLPLFPLTPVQPLHPIQPLHPLVPLLPLTPTLPLTPLHPVQPLHPLVPLLPLHPLLPLQPVQPLFPLTPLLPLQPLHPLLPLAPLRPLSPIGPDPGPISPGHGRGASLSADDLRQLEEMIIQSKRGGLL
jgi:subtilisin family serine protease